MHNKVPNTMTYLNRCRSGQRIFAFGIFQMTFCPFNNELKLLLNYVHILPSLNLFTFHFFTFHARTHMAR